VYNKPQSSDALKDVLWQDAAAIMNVIVSDVFANLQTCNVCNDRASNQDDISTLQNGSTFL
jgi:hypothetical protein